MKNTFSLPGIFLIIWLAFLPNLEAHQSSLSNVTITTEVVSLGNISQGVNNNIVYMLRMDVASTSVILNSFSMTTSGTYDSDDFSAFTFWHSPNPNLTGALNLRNDLTISGTGETITFGSLSRNFIVGTHYLIITSNVAKEATDENTIHMNGGLNPAILTFQTSPITSDNQSNNAGVKTIQAADVTITTEAITVNDIFQGSSANIVYVLRMNVAVTSVHLDNLSMVSSGTYAGSDIISVTLGRNSSPSLTGSLTLGIDNTLTGAGETVNFPGALSTFAVGTHYLLLFVRLANAATDNQTIHFDGGTNPAVLTFTTAPNLTDLQANNAGIQTIQAADITISTEAISSINVSTGTSNHIRYLLRMDVATTSVLLSNFSMTSSGTYASGDITSITLRRNSSPSFISSLTLGIDNTLTGAGETVNFPGASSTFAVGTHYLLLTVNISPGAVFGNTLHFDSGMNPAVLTFITTPNITNNQSNNAGVLTIGFPFYHDSDADGFGNSNSVIYANSQPMNYVSNSDDCDDTHANIFPGAPEICDGLDNDCDEWVDDNDIDISGQLTWYEDIDGDGFGDAQSTVISCHQPQGFVGMSGDECPNDPNKVAPGICGCGVADADTDGDGTADCDDECPNDPNKVAPGICGCGVADSDTDGDGTADCDDECPNDPDKVAPGICGCGVADADTDGDGTADCDDECPNDPNKVVIGICGCGVADSDTDGDGTADCDDECPNDPNKVAPGICGCGMADSDTDGDGFYACIDDCDDLNPDAFPGAQELCGNGIDEDCDGEADEGCSGCDDQDDDGICDQDDNCPQTANPGQVDSDCDGVGNACDVCPGGDDSVDNNNDGLPDCKYPPTFSEIIAAWKCGNNKVYVAHGTKNGSCNTLCVSYNALSAHINHGDYIGPCNHANCGGQNKIGPNSSGRTETDGAHFDLYPNPHQKGQGLVLRLSSLQDELGLLTILDLQGRVLLRQNWTMEQGLNQMILNNLKLNTGLYFVTIRLSDQVLTKRLIIQE